MLLIGRLPAVGVRVPIVAVSELDVPRAQAILGWIQDSVTVTIVVLIICAMFAAGGKTRRIPEPSNAPGSHQPCRVSERNSMGAALLHEQEAEINGPQSGGIFTHGRTRLNDGAG